MCELTEQIPKNIGSKIQHFEHDHNEVMNSKVGDRRLPRADMCIKIS
jgi:hypothetical protein